MLHALVPSAAVSSSDSHQDQQIGDASLKRTYKTNAQVVEPAASGKPRIPEAQPADDADSSKKRKRNELDESDPNFQEYLQVMQPRSKRAGALAVESAPAPEAPAAEEIKATESDDEYEDIPARQQARKPKATESAADQTVPGTRASEKTPQPEQADNAPAPPLEPPQPAAAPSTGATDDEWLRSRTNRLLDLLDDDEPLPPMPAAPVQNGTDGADTQMTGTDEGRGQEAEAPRPEAAEVQESADEPKQEDEDADTTLVRKTARLFVRNLPFSATEDDLNVHFGQYGEVEEVRLNPHFIMFVSSPAEYDESRDRDI